MLIIGRFLRWSSHNVYLRYSKRVKQLKIRMNHMIRENINEFPGDHATNEEFLRDMKSKRREINIERHRYLCLFSFVETLEVIVRTSVYHIQEVRRLFSIDF